MRAPAFRVVPIAEEHIADFRAVVDSVARERRYLAMLQAFPMEETARFVRESIAKGNPHVVALADARVVGWCDIQPMPRETLAHGGVLGMGLLESYRGKGIGAALMRAALARAKEVGLTRVELTVRADNLRAKALYEKVGFMVEGIKRNAALFDGRHFDLLLMAILFERSSAS
jgi:RimJ/RimL family protein N-acetyltransferase